MIAVGKFFYLYVSREKPFKPTVRTALLGITYILLAYFIIVYASLPILQLINLYVYIKSLFSGTTNHYESYLNDLHKLFPSYFVGKDGEIIKKGYFCKTGRWIFLK